jgi:hypothetical protein
MLAPRYSIRNTPTGLLSRRRAADGELVMPSESFELQMNFVHGDQNGSTGCSALRLLDETHRLRVTKGVANDERDSGVRKVKCLRPANRLLRFALGK